jgi:hypothetical protein
MANPFIHYQVTGGIEYASVYTPRKVNGKKDNQPQYLGRVIDKEKGIYRNKERGTFEYSLADGYRGSPQSVQKQKEEKLILDFGDSYVLQQVLKNSGYWDLFRSILPGKEDTLCAMLFYHVLRGGANRYAYDWWSESYASVIFPKARVESQRISEFLEDLGSERIERDFFKDYLARISDGQKNHGILIDSTGMPNDIHFPLTAINNHNGVISNETRLILTIDRITKMPLLFRYNAGNIVDVSTLKSTLLELTTYGVNVDFSILDAGYFSEKNIKGLYKSNIRFVTRLNSNRKLYKDLVSKHVDELESSANVTFYRNRLLYIKKVGVKLCGHDGYAYVAIDHQRRADELYQFMKNTAEDKDMTAYEVDLKAKTKGTFIILSSESAEISEIVPLYYTRQNIEQVFDIYKNNADLLPLRTHSEKTFRGHLMLSFLSTIVYMLVNSKLEGSKYCADGAFRTLHNLKCKVFDDCILIKEANKKSNEISKHLNIELPLSLKI